MKKFAKMSLVAAVAVAGLTSTVSAKDLSEAIKGVDISGTAVIRYNDYQNDSTTNVSSLNQNNNYYKMVVNAKVPVNDTLTFNTTVSSNANMGAESARAQLDSEGESVDISKMNFSSTAIANTVVVVGKQAVNSPFTLGSDSDGQDDTGSGIAAIVKAGPATITAAYFNSTNFTLTTGGDLAVIIANANVAGIALEAAYADESDKLDVYSLAADYTLPLDGAKVSFGVRHSASDYDDNTTKGKITQGKLAASAGMFSAYVRYGTSGKKGGEVAYNANAKADMLGWNTKLLGSYVDADYTMFNIAAQLIPTLNVALNHNDLDVANGTAGDKKEIFTQITWTPSKNFYTYLRAGKYEENAGAKSTVGRVQAEFKF